MSELVWYAAYGSNLSRERFTYYLNGGTPAGASHEFPGCRDCSEPLDDRPSEIPCELAFGGTSITWGGGVAFVDTQKGETALSRLYLVTVGQLEDVIAQENWLLPGEVSLSGAPGEAEVVIAREHMYGLVLRLGEVEGRPLITFTQHKGAKLAKPSMSYLRHVAAGLRQSHALGTDEVVSYLAGKRGIRGAFSPDELHAAVGAAD